MAGSNKFWHVLTNSVMDWLRCLAYVPTITVARKIINLYASDLIAPSFLRKVFIELMQAVTKSVEFSFNNVMYQQIDGVAMGYLLGPALANIFVGYYESLLFRRVKKPPMYYGYVDDTFAVFNSENDCDEFLYQLNFLHPFLRFTFEKEVNQSLSFLDVQMKKISSKLIKSVYRNSHLQYNN